MIRLRYMRRAALALAIAGWAIPAQALDPQSTFQVSARIEPGCIVLGTGATSGAVGQLGTLDFGTVSALSTQSITAAMTSTLSLRCTPGTSLQVSIDGGLHHFVMLRSLQRTGGTDFITYGLYRDAGLTQVIGINEPFTVPIGSADDIVLPIYGRVTAGANEPGTYTDTLLVTLDW